MKVRDIDLLRRQLTLASGEAVPITNMFDIYGDDTDDPREASTVVAGPMADGQWIAAETTVDEVGSIGPSSLDALPVKV